MRRSQLAYLALELALIVGCFWVILAPTTQQDNVAAFGLLGVLSASIVQHVKDDRGDQQ